MFLQTLEKWWSGQQWSGQQSGFIDVDVFSHILVSLSIILKPNPLKT